MEKTVESWDELMDLIYSDSWDTWLRRHRSKYVFRGLPKHDYSLVPGIDRIGSHKNLADIEILLVSDFRQYAQSDATVGDSVWNWLAVAQHHGLPTRFLDWTYSPYVALHFATENLGAAASADNAVIWCVNYKETNENLPTVLKEKLSEYRKQVFSVETLDKTVKTLTGLDKLSDTRFLFFLEPPSLDSRIVNQAALFSVMSRPEYFSGSREKGTLDEYLGEEELRRDSQKVPLFKKLIIPAALKWEIRDKLDQANTTERVIYPGLDGLSSWLRRHYTKKPNDLVVNQSPINAREGADQFVEPERGKPSS